MPVIELPNGQPAEFPDDMSMDQIKAVLREKFPPENTGNLQQPNAPTKSNVDTIRNATGIGQPGFMGNFAGGLLNSLAGIARSVPDLSESVPERFQKVLPYATGQRPIDNFDAYKAMGTTDQPFNSLAGAEQLAGELFTPGKVVKNAFPLIKEAAKPITNAFIKIDPKEIANSIQKHHDSLVSSAEDLFNNVSQEVYRRGLNIVPIKTKLIDSIKLYFPKTKATEKLIKEAKSGDYSSLRNLQAELWQRGTKSLKSLLPSESIKGEEMLDLRNQINSLINSHFIKNQSHDLANLLNDAKGIYKDLKNTYFSNKTPNAIKNLVHPDSRKMPKNIINVLSEESIPMNKVKAANPLADRSVKLAKDKENALSRLKYIGIGGGALAGLSTGASLINKLISGTN